MQNSNFRFNDGPVVVDLETAEICRQNFIEALDDLQHPVYLDLFDGIIRVSQKHIDCDCSACEWLENYKRRRAMAKAKKPLPKYHEWKPKHKQKRTEKPWLCDNKCTDPKHARGMCKRHYKAYIRYFPDDRVQETNVGKVCKSDGCERDARIKGMCRMHYKRWHRAQSKQTVEAPVQSKSTAWVDKPLLVV